MNMIGLVVEGLSGPWKFVGGEGAVLKNSVVFFKRLTVV